jgi:hypothetical protein
MTETAYIYCTSADKNKITTINIIRKLLSTFRLLRSTILESHLITIGGVIGVIVNHDCYWAFSNTKSRL